MPALVDFIRESNRIKGILRDPTETEIAAHERFMSLAQLDLTAVADFQAVITPGKPVRSARGMNVRVGNYIAPEGGPDIVRELTDILALATTPFVRGAFTLASKSCIHSWTAMGALGA